MFSVACAGLVVAGSRRSPPVGEDPLQASCAQLAQPTRAPPRAAAAGRPGEQQPPSKAVTIPPRRARRPARSAAGRAVGQVERDLHEVDRLVLSTAASRRACCRAKWSRRLAAAGLFLPAAARSVVRCSQRAVVHLQQSKRALAAATRRRRPCPQPQRPRHLGRPDAAERRPHLGRGEQPAGMIDLPAAARRGRARRAVHRRGVDHSAPAAKNACSTAGGACARPPRRRRRR